MKRILLIGLFVVLAFVVMAGFLAARQPEAPWFSAVANGNGYDVLVRAASQMNGKLPEEATTVAPFVKANERMFEMVGAALKMPCEMPATKYSVSNSMPTDFTGFKRIALALRARGEEAEEREAKSEAVTNYTSIIDLGQRVEHGPLIALLVGVALEKIGLDALEKVAIGLGPAQRTEVADKIESLDRERLPFKQVMLREKYFARQVAGNPLKLLMTRFLIRPALVKAEQKRDRISADFQRVAKEVRASRIGDEKK